MVTLLLPSVAALPGLWDLAPGRECLPPVGDLG